jgi:hypothetical protein
MEAALNSEWGRLFRNWERLQPDELGFPTVGEEAPQLQRVGMAAFWRSWGILWTALVEAPELAAARRRRQHAAGVTAAPAGETPAAASSPGRRLWPFLLALLALLVLARRRRR